MIELGKIERITDLRTVWKHEARDFSKWLAKEENLKELSDTIEIDIDPEELESAVGSFSVDILATDQATGRKVIIENQLEDTNHDHLGKIITYASGKDAKVIIWIVKRARDEHRQAIEWLNQHTDEEIGFFLLEIELWKIGNSAPAPKFNIIARPNDWAKTVKSHQGLSEIKKVQLEFWKAFNDYAFAKTEFNSKFSKRKAQPQHWYDLSVGSSMYHISLTANTQKKRLGTSIYFSNGKEPFEKLKSHKVAIEAELGMELDWREGGKHCNMIALKTGDITKNIADWNKFYDWYIEMIFKLKEILNKYSG